MKKLNALIKEYFIPAFHFINKEKKIYLIIVFFILLNFLFTFFNSTNRLLSLLNIFPLFFSWAYSLSVPALFKQYFDKKELGFRFIASTLKENSKRLIVPGIVIYVLQIFTVIIIFIGGFFLYRNGINQKITTEEVGNFLTFFSTSLVILQKQPLFYFLSFPINFIISLFAFQAVFFAVEKRGYFISFLDSFKFSIKNLHIICLFTIINIILGLSILITPVSVNPSSFRDLYVQILLLVINIFRQYFGVVITAALTLYYLKLKSKKGTVLR